MQILLAKKRFLLSFTLSVITLFFSNLSFSYNPGLFYDSSRNDPLTGTFPNGIDESRQGCVYRESSGDWTVDDCDYVGAHYACYNGSQWKVAQAIGTVTKPGEPLDGNATTKTKSINSWDPIKADTLCKSNFGPAYFFSVPVNEDENEQLGNAITNIVAAKKRTWVYYYSNTDNFSLSENYWLGNRTEYTNLLGDNLTNTDGLGGVADCTLMHRDTQKGLWQDASCSEQHSFACFDAGTWFITKEQGEWKSGFEVCDEHVGSQGLYMVPRDTNENDLIRLADLPDSGTGIAENYNKVWLNRTDLAFEEFFISNQTRQAWWGEGQPTNRRNSDCATINSTGAWIAEPCNGYLAYHACYLGDNSSGDAQWKLTDKKAEFALGFGYCKQFDGVKNSEYRPPSSAASNNALAVLVSQLPESKFVWVNYSDQVSEGFWKAASPYQDFVTLTNVVDGEIGCGYYSLDTDDKRNWLVGQCYDGGASLTQGFACTNGYEWKIATEALSGGAPLKSDLWKDGFSACKAAFGEDYEFAAPYDADQNSRLSLALKLSGSTQAWMNLNDAESEGSWVSNGPEVNLPPVIKSLTTDRDFQEKEVINLSVLAEDPEKPNSALTYQWSIIETRVGLSNAGTDVVIAPTLSNAATPNVSLSAVDLVSDDYYVDLQVNITDTDNPSATTTKVITIKIKSPLRAAYDFNQFTDPSLDVSGNDHDLILDTSIVDIISKKNDSNDYFAKLDSSASFSIDGSLAGLQLDSAKEQYTVIYSFKVDDIPNTASAWAGFMQKGESPFRQPGIFFDKINKQIQATNSTSIDSNENIMSKEKVRVGQWMTVAYVKDVNDADDASSVATGKFVRLYIDKVEDNLLDPLTIQSVPDSTLVLSDIGTGYDSGNWTFGKVPGAPEGIVGGFDDIRIYDRALTPAELLTIIPTQPQGEFQFANNQYSGAESEIENNVSELIIPVSRVAGDDGAVSVGFKLTSDTAILDTDFRLKDDTSIGADRGKGELTWGGHDAEDKNIIVELIGDTLREGTETFSIELVKLEGQPILATNTQININIVDKTPNPYGAIGIAPAIESETTPVNVAVDEGGSGFITVERIGSGSTGAFDVTYEIVSLTADSLVDFTITQPGFIASGNAGTNTVIGGGRLTFADDAAANRQIKTISFDTNTDSEREFDESFTVNLLAVTDPGQSSLVSPATSAILGTMRAHTQIINDISIGRVSFNKAAYSVNEVNDGSSNNSITVALERLGGDDGDMCITLDRVLTSTAETVDYSIAYSDSSAAGQTDVFWADQDSSVKLVTITAVNDQVFEPNEIIELSWSRKGSCKGKVTVIPDASETSDITSAAISIVDDTTRVKLKFSQPSYTVLETGLTASITVKATQARIMVGGVEEGDFTNPINNNNFKVLLTRTDDSAIEGTDFDGLSTKDILTFAASETEKTITFDIRDNCSSLDSLSAAFGLNVSEPSLGNTLSANEFDLSDASSTLVISNVIPTLTVTTGVNNNGVVDGANFVNGRYRVTSAGGSNNNGFDPSTLKIVASTTNTNTTDACPVTYQWNLVSTTPELPSGNDLPSAFSSSIPNDLGQNTATEFTLPFVVADTQLAYKLTVTHPELDNIVLEDQVPIGAYWQRLRNNGDAFFGNPECLNSSGGSLIETDSCTSTKARNFTYNKATQQIVGQNLAGDGVSYGCLDGLGYGVCSSNTNQKWTYPTGVSGCANRTHLIIAGSDNTLYEYFGDLKLATNRSQATCNSRSWDWVGTP